MKKQVFIFLLTGLLFTSCARDIATPAIQLDEKIPENTPAKYAGDFNSGPYGSVKGAVKIYTLNNKYVLALENIAVSNGPDLHVYLSGEVQPVNFIDLGKLKSTNGNQLYDVAGKPDFSAYPYVLIHCQQYNHLFGSAALK